jgi:hypothetical protein
VLDAAGRLELPSDAFAEAERAGALAVEDDRVRFRHPLLRSLAYRGAPREQRRARTGALAGCLTAAPAPESERGLGTSPPRPSQPDEDVAARSLRAGERFATAPATSPPPTPTSAPPSSRPTPAAAASASSRPPRRRGWPAGRPARASCCATPRALPSTRAARRHRVQGGDARGVAGLGRGRGRALRALADDVSDPTRPRRARRSRSPPAPRSPPATPSAALTSAAPRGRAAGPRLRPHRAARCARRSARCSCCAASRRRARRCCARAADWFEAEGELPGRDYVAQALLWVEDYALARRLLDPLLAHARRVGDCGR